MKTKMKKLLCILMAAAMMASITACGSSSSAQTEAPTEAATEAAPEVSVKDSLELLTTVWNSYGDDEKFSAGGGDAANIIMDAPGAFALDDAAALDSTLGFPEAAADQIDDAASLMHMMNANTFTSFAVRAKDAAAVSDLASTIKDNILKRQWICGFPDQLLVATVGPYVVTAFGAEDLMTTFRGHLTECYPEAAIAAEEAITGR